MSALTSSGGDRSGDEGCERYPLATVLTANAVALAIYGLGTAIVARHGAGPAFVYVACCLWVELRVLTKSCRNCWYYGRRCGFGKEQLCALLFPKGDPGEFLRKEISWWDLVPDLAVGLLPVVAGVVLLLRGFSWPLLLMVLALLGLSTAGNAFVRGVLVCRRCRQRELGCPAQKLFEPRP
jgi:hypothetical protein